MNAGTPSSQPKCWSPTTGRLRASRRARLEEISLLRSQHPVSQDGRGWLNPSRSLVQSTPPVAAATAQPLPSAITRKADRPRELNKGLEVVAGNPFSGTGDSLCQGWQLTGNQGIAIG